MKQEKYLTPQDLCSDWRTLFWFPAWRLVTLAWAKPFLALMGLPQALVEQPEVWEPICTAAFADYETQMEVADGLPGDDFYRIERLIKPYVIARALHQLAQKLGRNVAVEFERWVRRHFLCIEVESAMFDWRIVLFNGTLPPNTRGSQVPPPAVLMPLLPEIEDLVSYDRMHEIEEALNLAMPEPFVEWEGLDAGEVVVVWSRDGDRIAEVIRQELTIRALRFIAQNLNDTELKEVVAWAQAQAEVRYVTSPENLRGDKYLRVEPPFYDAPSVLDFLDFDEERDAE